jgi:FAD/FMN-containing dehydrogenase
MIPLSETLLSIGGLYETTARIHRPASVDELAALFAQMRHSGKRITLIGARRSFGRHFLPPDGVDGLDTTVLGGTVTRLERTDDGLWVRVPGSHTFERLWVDLPDHLPRHPPTGDRITVAGALASCSHNTSGFFARDVRAFRLMTPDGSVFDCRPDSAGRAGALYRCVPGSFGALGVILDVELFLRRVRADERVEICVIERCPIAGLRALDRLDHLHENGDYPLGLGIFFYGAFGPSVLLGDRSVGATPGSRTSVLPLVDDATRRNVVFQGLAHRAPSIAHRLQTLLLQKGKCFRATPYGFAYYQRSYERAYDILSGGSWWARALRHIGVDPRLTVCHQTFVIPIARARDFLAYYFEALRKTPRVVARLELQDAIRLPPGSWPLHGAYGMPGGCYLFSVSFSVKRDAACFADVQRFLGRVTREAFERFGVRVLLLKQTHCDAGVLRRMHASFLDDLESLRADVDPHRTLTSQLLEELGA